MISPNEMIEAIKSWCKGKFITEIPIGSDAVVGAVKADGSTTTIDKDGTIHATGGSGSGTSDYNALSNRPSIGGVTLSGDKTLSELGIQPEGTYLTEETDPTVPDWAKAGSKPSYTANEVGADKSGTAESKVSSHNTSTDSHSDIRLLIEGLQSKVNAVLDSDDETLDQMSEIVVYIKDNKELIEAITTNKVSVSDIVDNLTTNISNKPLSAAQGVALKALIDGIVVPTKTSELTNDSGFLTGYTETDPTVPSWAKEPSKPTYTASEVGADAAGSASTALANAKEYVDQAISNLVGGAPETLNTLKEISDALAESGEAVEAINQAIGNKLDKTGDSKDNTVTFTQASTRENIASSETHATLFGKIAKWFADLKTVAFSGSYNDLSDKPSIPTVNNATLTIQKNGTNVQTFTANASSNKTANITVPTKISELTNDSGFIAGYTETDPTVPSWAKESTKPTYSKSEVGLGNVPNVSTNNQTPTFTEATERANIDSGEKLSVIFGKVMKWFTDLKPHAFVAPITNLLATVAGSSLDATMGKELDDKISANATAIEETKNGLNAIHNIKTYYNVSQLGITSWFIPDIIQAMPNNSNFCCDVSAGIRDVAENKMPLTLGILTIEKVTSSRFRVMYNYSSSNSVGQIYIASINIADMTVNGWYKFAVEAV